MTTPLRDARSRPMRSLRISVTDRCNLRCRYCMPEESYVWLDHAEILTFEETDALARAFTSLGASRIRLTGGEPLLRRDLPALVRLLAANVEVRDLALTTNGVLLPAQARPLREAGLRRVTVSLDTLRPERFAVAMRRDAHAQVVRGIEAAREAGFDALKINVVVMRGFNDDELAGMIEFGRRSGAEVRFIEYMDVGGATRWRPGDVVPRREMIEILERRYGTIRPLPGDGAAPADQFVLPDGSVFGVISSTTQPFCGACDRSRLTADGMWFLCLYARSGVDLKRLLRGGASGEETVSVIAAAWRGRADRGAEERLEILSRGALYQAADLRMDPHREMHTRGG